MFSFSIDLPRHIIKKNRRPIWRGRIGKSVELKRAEEFLTLALRMDAKRQGIETPIKGALHVQYTFVFGKDQSRSLKLSDLSNLIELPQDCLQAAGVIENDRFIQSLDGTRKVAGEKTQLLIEVKPFSFSS